MLVTRVGSLPTNSVVETPFTPVTSNLCFLTSSIFLSFGASKIFAPESTNTFRKSVFVVGEVWGVERVLSVRASGERERERACGERERVRTCGCPREVGRGGGGGGAFFRFPEVPPVTTRALPDVGWVSSS